jgi:ribose 5-phosphate isomerase B
MEEMKVIAIGCDHAGFEYKEMLKRKLKKMGYVPEDFGTYSLESVDYPDFSHPVANSVESGFAKLGVLICGSANGVAMAANKHQGVRAAIAWKKELAELARTHNDANVICIPARFVSKKLATDILEAFLLTAFEGGRHTARRDKISC